MTSVDAEANRGQTHIAPEYLSILKSSPEALRGLIRGVEKESLRVASDGSLSNLPHPPSLGSPLTHTAITTDFSEAQLELITTVHDSAAKCLRELTDVHRFVYQNISHEMLWPSSMPCIVGDDDDIPVGQYGSSNIGRTKTVYRRGLGLRYGRLMQTISGIHYNFSLPEHLWQALGITTQSARTAAYFGLIRNFRRWSWLLIYLFGASPAVCRSFTRNLQHELVPFDEGSHHLPYATSLRMGPLGYQSSAQSSLHISYNSLDEYANSMVDALTQTYPEYAQHGVMKDGEYQQLNSAVLQIENEFYGTVRPKRRVNSGERPVAALRERGVEYVEVRCLDLNPFLPAGLDEPQMHFLDTFLLLCLLADSGPDSVAEFSRMSANQLAVVERGREPSLTLVDDAGDTKSMVEWGTTLLQQCEVIAELLDAGVSEADEAGKAVYARATEDQKAKLANPGLTPSAQVLETMKRENVPFFHFSMQQGLAHKTHFEKLPLSPPELEFFRLGVAESLRQQKSIEDQDQLSFEAFLEEYLAIPDHQPEQQRP
jgi:glutamate--cysteine ligase